MVLDYKPDIQPKDKEIGNYRSRAIGKLKELRLQRCWTQQQLATFAGVGLATVKQIEAGMHPARLSTVKALAQALQVESSELLGLYFK